jgi:hypothetical protein
LLHQALHEILDRIENIVPTRASSQGRYMTQKKAQEARLILLTDLAFV